MRRYGYVVVLGNVHYCLEAVVRHIARCTCVFAELLAVQVKLCVGVAWLASRQPRGDRVQRCGAVSPPPSTTHPNRRYLGQSCHKFKVSLVTRTLMRTNCPFSRTIQIQIIVFPRLAKTNDLRASTDSISSGYQPIVYYISYRW